MSNWFKKLFGGKCNCDHCSCGAKEEVKPTVETPPATPAASISEVKPETAPEEPGEKIQ